MQQRSDTPARSAAVTALDEYLAAAPADDARACLARGEEIAAWIEFEIALRALGPVPDVFRRGCDWTLSVQFAADTARTWIV